MSNQVSWRILCKVYRDLYNLNIITPDRLIYMEREPTNRNSVEV